MVYHGWSIGTHVSFGGYSAQYTSPSGRAYQTASCFQTEAQAAAYAQALIDHLLRCEVSRFQNPAGVALAR